MNSAINLFLHLFYYYSFITLFNSCSQLHRCEENFSGSSNVKCQMLEVFSESHYTLERVLYCDYCYLHDVARSKAQPNQ